MKLSNHIARSQENLLSLRTYKTAEQMEEQSLFIEKNSRELALAIRESVESLKDHGGEYEVVTLEEAAKTQRRNMLIDEVVKRIDDIIWS